MTGGVYVARNAGGATSWDKQHIQLQLGATHVVACLRLEACAGTAHVTCV